MIVIKKIQKKKNKIIFVYDFPDRKQKIKGDEYSHEPKEEFRQAIQALEKLKHSLPIQREFFKEFFIVQIEFKYKKGNVTDFRCYVESMYTNYDDRAIWWEFWTPWINIEEDLNITDEMIKDVITKSREFIEAERGQVDLFDKTETETPDKPDEEDNTDGHGYIPSTTVV